MTVDIRDHLRAVRLGRELAEQVVPVATTDTVSKVPLVTHASDVSNSKSMSARSLRWVGRGACVVIIGEGTIINSERKRGDELHTPMRRNTADGEATASKGLKVPSRSSTSADTLVMKGCPNTLSLGRE